MAKVKRKKRVDAVQIETPTPEQIGGGEFKRIGMHYRRVPVIDSLFDAGKLNHAQYAALAFYRNQAIQAEDDYARSSTLDAERVNGGGGSFGSGLPLVWTAAIAETGRIERDLGSLLDIARAIAVNDMTIAQWCIAKHGGRERYDSKGRFVAMVPACGQEKINIALMELKFAAGRITT